MFRELGLQGHRLAARVQLGGDVEHEQDRRAHDEQGRVREVTTGAYPVDASQPACVE